MSMHAYKVCSTYLSICVILSYLYACAHYTCTQTYTILYFTHLCIHSLLTRSNILHPSRPLHITHIIRHTAALTTELLNYLVVAGQEQKETLVGKVLQIVEKFSPNKKWRVDTICTMLSVSGETLDESHSRTAVLYLSQADGYQVREWYIFIY